MSLYFHHLALETASQASDNPGDRAPIVVIDTHNRYPRVVCANQAANEVGIVLGMQLSVAHALCNELIVHVQNHHAESTRLNFLACIASSFTANVSIDPPNILLLEIRASLKLFGGMRQLIRRLQAAINAQGHQAYYAIAPTASAAALLSTGYLAELGDQKPQHQSNTLPETLVAVSYQKTLALVRDLPINELIRHIDLPEKQYRTLIGMGLRQIKDLLRMPRDGLARRTTPGLIAYLDKVLGKHPESRSLYVPPTRFSLQRHFDEPVTDIEMIINVGNQLLQALVKDLDLRHAGINSLKWVFIHHKNKPTIITINLSNAARDYEHLKRVIRERLERLQFIEPVEGLALHTGAFVLKDQDSLRLFSGANASSAEDHRQARYEFLDRLRSRLGEHAVSGLNLVSEHRPEQAWLAPSLNQTPTMGANKNTSKSGMDHSANAYRHAQGNGYGPHQPQRPLWLLHEPRKLNVVDGEPQFNGPLILCRDCERIESGWWDDKAVLRDYFIAQNKRNTRIWIFRDLHDRTGNSWYLHGIFA